MNKNFYCLGLMSGTSIDGIDVSIIKSDGEQFIEIIDNLYIEYENRLRLELKKAIDLCNSRDEFNKQNDLFQELSKKITLKHFEACRLIAEKKQGSQNRFDRISWANNNSST